MNLFLSVDPGKRHCGIAQWNKATKELQRAFLCGPSKPSKPWLDFLFDIPRFPNLTDTNVMEVPQQYPGCPVRTEDLIQLAASAGAIAAHIGGTWAQARPGIWTRQWCQDKEIRLKRAWERLTPIEQSRVEMPKSKERQADILDAIALGLWALKR